MTNILSLSCLQFLRFRSLQPTVINRAAAEVWYARKLVEEWKFAASAEFRQQRGFEFIPLAIETRGGFSSDATSFLILVADRCVDLENIHFSNAPTWPCRGRTRPWFCKECRSDSLNLSTCVSAERSYLQAFTRRYQRGGPSCQDIYLLR